VSFHFWVDSWSWNGDLCAHDPADRGADGMSQCSMILYHRPDASAVIRTVDIGAEQAGRISDVFLVFG